MKSILNRTLMTVFLFIIACAANAGWHDETQATRNQQITAQGYHDLGLTGGACKVWVYDVVRVASNLAGGAGVPVLLPATTPYNGVPSEGYTWYANSNVTSYGALAPNAMVPGMIIQMRVKLSGGGYGPHTAIVYTNTPALSRMEFLESNYATPYVVTKRTVPYSWFTTNIEPTSHYTAYMIR